MQNDKKWCFGATHGIWMVWTFDLGGGGCTCMVTVYQLHIHSVKNLDHVKFSYMWLPDVDLPGISEDKVYELCMLMQV